MCHRRRRTISLRTFGKLYKKTSFLELSGSYSSAIQAMKYLPDHPVDILFWTYRCPNSTDWNFHAWFLKIPESFYYCLRPVCARRLSGKCTRLPAETHQLLRLHRSHQQGCPMVRTPTKGRQTECQCRKRKQERLYLCKK